MDGEVSQEKNSVSVTVKSRCRLEVGRYHHMADIDTILIIDISDPKYFDVIIIYCSALWPISAVAWCRIVQT